MSLSTTILALNLSKIIWQNSNDQLYELFNEGLVEVPPGSGFNVEIAVKLLIHLIKI
jgi:hypothetical protein